MDVTACVYLCALINYSSSYKNTWTNFGVRPRDAERLLQDQSCIHVKIWGNIQKNESVIIELVYLRNWWIIKNTSTKFKLLKYSYADIHLCTRKTVQVSWDGPKRLYRRGRIQMTSPAESYMFKLKV